MSWLSRLLAAPPQATFASLERDLAAERHALRDLSARYQVLSDDLTALRASLVERTHERDSAVRSAESSEAKLSILSDSLAYERQRNRDLSDRLIALTDRRALQTLRGELPPAPPAPADPPPHLRAPSRSSAPPFDPAKQDIEALFRMPD